jgi:hypothetical protein
MSEAKESRWKMPSSNWGDLWHRWFLEHHQGAQSSLMPKQDQASKGGVAGRQAELGSELIGAEKAVTSESPLLDVMAY